MSGTINNIITTEEVDKRPYMSDVHIPRITANVYLLIGTNAPKILEPWEVITATGMARTLFELCWDGLLMDHLVEAVVPWRQTFLLPQ